MRMSFSFDFQHWANGQNIQADSHKTDLTLDGYTSF